MTTEKVLEFDVLLSFSGPERAFARAIHDICINNGLRVFLDEEFQHEIWGENLVEYLDKAYRERGAYVLILISSSYCSRPFTRVERRSAFDRMISEPREYILPVKVDDSWISGLPTSTAYLDLRVHGVVGICELLVRKILGTNTKLTIPSSVFVPRVPLGHLQGTQLATYLLELCARRHVVAFGALVYDERNANLRKLLRDQDYWDALDKASGPHFEVFAIRDSENFEQDTTLTVKMITAASLSRSRSRGHYFSKLLKKYFGEDRTRLSYPSLLVFITEGESVQYCRLIPFRSSSIDETFQNLVSLLSSIAAGIDRVGGPKAHSEALWEAIKQDLLKNKYTVYIQSPPKELASAIDQLVDFVE